MEAAKRSTHSGVWERLTAIRGAALLGARAGDQLAAVVPFESRALGAVRRDAVEDLALGRQGHGPEDAAAVDGEGHVHGPVVPELGVFLGAVQRVHDPDPRLGEALGCVNGLLAQHAVVGVASGEQPVEQPVAGLVAHIAEGLALPAVERAQGEAAVAGVAGGGDGEGEVTFDGGGVQHWVEFRGAWGGACGAIERSGRRAGEGEVQLTSLDPGSGQAALLLDGPEARSTKFGPGRGAAATGSRPGVDREPTGPQEA